MLHRFGSIHSLAKTLGISVNTLKTLFIRGVFPRNLIHKTRGGHWRTMATAADVPDLKLKLQLSNFWHRKGIRTRFHPYRDHARQDELDELRFEAAQMSGPGFIFTTQDYERQKNSLAVLEELDSAIDRHGEMSRLGAPSLHRLVLRVAIAKFRQKEGSRRIRIGELSKFVSISVATLYRTIGKETLRLLLRDGAAELHRAEPQWHSQGLRIRTGRSTGPTSDRVPDAFWAPPS